MLSFCSKYRKETDSKNPQVTKTEKIKIYLLSYCGVCNSKSSTFIKTGSKRIIK